MTAYLGTAAVRDFIVPQEPPPDRFVAPNYERFDGLAPLVNNEGGTAFGYDYAPSPRNSHGPNTPPAEQTYTRAVNGGLTNTLGGQPQPVAHWADMRPTRGFTPAGSRVIGGPKMGRQLNNGIAETVFFSELQANPPQPGDLAAIIAGLG